ncbi:hypothetical protein BCR42DRAFT_421621 [Absidia repens]|uniref:polynucleotide adenylyltransferase n=1 Tax=Absidia repens TaxID=90262 RepID=A0A1X2I7K8_9FUNG|nr:hypothetical protein BCR42DRAFT_421621 [Absidia repens]
MPLPIMSSRNSIIEPKLDTSSLVSNTTPTTSHLEVNTVAVTTTNFPTNNISNGVTTPSSSCKDKHDATTADIQTMSTSLQSSTLSDSCSDDFINEPLQSPPTPPTELLLTDNNDFSSFLELDIPLMLDCVEEDHLSATMLALYEELLPTKESYNRRMGLVQKIELILNTEWPDRNIKANLFGSSVNDLGTNQSDVDLCITTQWVGLRNVRLLAKLFRRCGMQHVVCVPRAKVPIVRLFDTESQLACDMNVNNTMALHNTNMIRTYVAIDPRVRPLAMIIKHWTKQRLLNDAADGGTLSTYTWTCMIINFLQMRQPPILPVLHQMRNDNDSKEMFCSDVEKLLGFGDANHESLGGLLFAFFRRYAIEFDYDDQVISVRHGRYLSKREKGWHIGRNKTSLCVEEPFNVTRNLGNSADIRSVQGIRMELNRALEMLVSGTPWDSICAPFETLSFGSSTSIGISPPIYYSSTLSPIQSDDTMKNSTSTPKHVPSTAKHPPVFLPTFITDTNHLTELHPFERRKSMTYTQRPHDFDQPPLSYRLHTINQGFHRRNGTSLPALMETIPAHQDQLISLLPTSPSSNNNDSNSSSSNSSGSSSSNGTFTTYTSPSLAPPSSVVTQHQSLSFSPEQHRTVDAIFARYHRHHPRYHSSQDISLMHLQQPNQYGQGQQQQHSLRAGNGGKKGLSSRRRSSQNNGTNNKNNNHNTNSSNNNSTDWPTISQHPKPCRSNSSQHLLQSDIQEQQRRRRWSTTKKATAPSSSDTLSKSISTTSQTTIEIKLPTKERTLADIVKLDGNKLRLTTTAARTDRSQSVKSAQQHQHQQRTRNGNMGSVLTPSVSVSSTSSSSSSASVALSPSASVKQSKQHQRLGPNKSTQSRFRKKTKD